MIDLSEKYQFVGDTPGVSLEVLVLTVGHNPNTPLVFVSGICVFRTAGW